MAGKNHCCYIVECRGGELYCGYSNNVEKRVDAHNNGSGGAKYTRSRRPVKLVYCELFVSKSDALKRERQIKKLTRKEKLNLINSSANLLHSYNY